MTEAAYTVTGMTCEHCVRSVTEEITELAGVLGVEVELATGRVTVTSDQPVPPDALRAAVTDAGYQLAT